MARAIVAAFIFILTGLAQATSYSLPLPQGMTELELDSLFAEYCGPVGRLTPDIPRPNYENPLVREAARRLNTVAPVSYYLYPAIIASYGFRRGTDGSFPWEFYEEVLGFPGNQSFGEETDSGTGEVVFSEESLRNKFDYEFTSAESPAPEGVRGNSHAFLTYLCGEFRDRPTLIEEKLKWLGRLYKLPAHPQRPIPASSQEQDIWSKMSAESYAYFVTFSRAAFDDRRDAVKNQGPIRLGPYEVDRPVPAFSVCEVKYMLTEYVSQPSPQQRQYPGWDKYQSGLASYAKSFCSQADLDDYYDFRGDSNIKPNSPESNGMIWYSTSMMNRCARNGRGEVSVRQVRVDGELTPLNFPIEQCQSYLSHPFADRWNAARAGLATWLFHHQQFDSIFSYTKNLVQILPTFSSEREPAGFRLQAGDYWGSDLENFLPAFASDYSNLWPQSDIGFNDVFGLSGQAGFIDEAQAYRRLRNAVNRHTDWYASGYDDSHFEPRRARVLEQAYSPFVASSYEMSESDGFTAPGITVRGPMDGRRHWMYVFRVHKSKWYTTESLAEGVPLDFELHWLDETSFGTTHLAKVERAWDRLGTPLEGEMDAILYLHNIKSTGRPIKNLSPSDYPAIIDDGLGETHEFP